MATNYGEETINGVRYETFLLEKSQYGGMTKSYALYFLQSEGINARQGGHSPFVNCYPILVEKKDSRRAQKLLGVR